MDAMDSFSRWCLGRVEKIDDNSSAVHIKFDCWNKGYNEVLFGAMGVDNTAGIGEAGPGEDAYERVHWTAEGRPEG